MKQILVFVLFAAVLCWTMFAPTYKHILIFRQAMLQKEVDYMLEIGANGSYGYVDAMAIAASRQRLGQHGFQPDKLEYSVAATNGSTATSAAAPVLRGAGIELIISYPYDHLFHIDRLIGMTVPSDYARMAASGLKMSEYVP
ncbi:hypothetical protein ACFFNY_18825 [Paenibacillus hodogayensis]|uniref:SsuA/THI5-like domain-containing protein n=1 Tax=Paenibacillus hodogayensis TaxID=279208 RepID=A0ABV5VZ98_9BACL